MEGVGGSKIVENRRASFMDVPIYFVIWVNKTGVLNCTLLLKAWLPWGTTHILRNNL